MAGVQAEAEAMLADCPRKWLTPLDIHGWLAR